MNGSSTLEIRRVDPARLNRAAGALADLLGVELDLAQQIVQSAPLTLLSRLDLPQAEQIRAALRPLAEAGAELAVRPARDETIPEVTWPVAPSIAGRPLAAYVAPPPAAAVTPVIICPHCGGTIQLQLGGAFSSPAASAPAPAPAAPRPAPLQSNDDAPTVPEFAAIPPSPPAAPSPASRPAPFPSEETPTSPDLAAIPGLAPLRQIAEEQEILDLDADLGILSDFDSGGAGFGEAGLPNTDDEDLIDLEKEVALLGDLPHVAGTVGDTSILERISEPEKKPVLQDKIFVEAPRAPAPPSAAKPKPKENPFPAINLPRPAPKPAAPPRPAAPPKAIPPKPAAPKPPAPAQGKPAAAQQKPPASKPAAAPAPAAKPPAPRPAPAPAKPAAPSAKPKPLASGMPLPSRAAKPAAPVAAKPSAPRAPAPAPAAPPASDDKSLYTVFAPKTRNPAMIDLLMEIQQVDRATAEALSQKPLIPVAKDVPKDRAETISRRLRESKISTRISRKK